MLRTKIKLGICLGLIVVGAYFITKLAYGRNTTFELFPEQLELCEEYGEQYQISPYLLQALIETVNTDSSFDISTRYGLCKLDGDIYGYYYKSDKAQIKKVCQIFISAGYEEADIPLSKYAGQSEYSYEGFVETVLNRTYELETSAEGVK